MFLSAFLIAETVYTVRSTGHLDDYSANSISVSGKGEVTAKPEDIIATFSFGAQATSESVDSAQEQSAKSINDAIAFLKAEGVDEKDIQTTAYDVYPHYEWIDRPCTNGYCPGGSSVPTGFDVNQTVTVKIRDTKKAGEILAGIGKKNVTNISGLNFTIDDSEALADEARELAIKDARERAIGIADALGVELGDVVSFYENGPTPYPMYEGGYAMDAMSVKVSPDVSTGEQKVTVEVSVNFQIES